MVLGHATLKNVEVDQRKSGGQPSKAYGVRLKQNLPSDSTELLKRERTREGCQQFLSLRLRVYRPVGRLF